MSFEPFLAFFLIRYLRKSLRTFSPTPEWDRNLLISMYAVIGLFILDIVLPIEAVTKWIWYALLLVITWITLNEPKLSQARNVMYAVLPLIIVMICEDALKAIEIKLYNKIDQYLGIALAAAITWAATMLFKSIKQNKALEKERKKTQEKEERNKFIAAQKDQLELLVAARTVELTKQKEELQHAIADLKSTQAQLIQSEKMASLGELTAGIAHEIQNPLNFVNNFSEVNTELIEEMKAEIKAGNIEEVILIANDIKDNEEKINHHGKRADAIVKGMLQHSRTTSVQKEPTDINALADEYLRLSYHGLRAKDKSFNAIMQTYFDESLGKINVIPQDLGRVILNLFTNAFYSLKEKQKLKNEEYKPMVSVTTKALKPAIKGMAVEIRVKDNGVGIPKETLEKIFQPFFTTKPTGQGTGLGLSLSYDIIAKGHGGKMTVETKEGEFAEFIIQLPA
jgi:two-component system NtrC family sensor kinase